LPLPEEKIERDIATVRQVAPPPLNTTTRCLTARPNPSEI
jgi:hypothetical protein